jgi:hypothetical protein
MVAHDNQLNTFFSLFVLDKCKSKVENEEVDDNLSLSTTSLKRSGFESVGNSRAYLLESTTSLREVEYNGKIDSKCIYCLIDITNYTTLTQRLAELKVPSHIVARSLEVCFTKVIS